MKAKAFLSDKNAFFLCSANRNLYNYTPQNGDEKLRSTKIAFKKELLTAWLIDKLQDNKWVYRFLQVF